MDRPQAPAKPFGEFYQRTQELPPSKQTNSFLSKIPKKGIILDFGAGTGRWSAAFLRDRPDLSIDAIDRHIERANLLDDDRVHKIKSDFEEFTPEREYDGIWAFAALLFLKPAELEKSFRQLATSLKQGGIIEFSMVHDCEAAKQFGVYGQSRKAIDALIEKNGLLIESLLLDEEAKYGKNGLVIPTYDVRATKL
jgi:trans-aconitate methyltransferase